MRAVQKIFWILFVLLLPLHGAQASRVEPLVNVDRHAIARADGKPLTLKQIEQAIVVASTRQRFWSVSPVKEGVMVGTMNINGKHQATVDITYDTATFSIKYRDSTRLLYQNNENGVPLIHHNYNRLVQNLRSAIAQNVLLIQD